METSERMERWIKVSIGLGRFEIHMMPLIQSLGRLDVQLCDKDGRLTQAYAIGSKQLEDPDFIYDHLTMSYLWVLGAYEAIRTLTQQAREQPSEASAEVLEKLKEAKSRFARLRVPLAKMQPADAHKRTDSHIAYPGINAQHGIAWQLNELLVISRWELSEIFLETLEFVRAVKLSQLAGTPQEQR